jgi:hypothetical protein
MGDFLKYRSSPHCGLTFPKVNIFTKERIGFCFGRFFSQTHQVTLLSSHLGGMSSTRNLCESSASLFISINVCGKFRSWNEANHYYICNGKSGITYYYLLLVMITYDYILLVMITYYYILLVMITYYYIM